MFGNLFAYFTKSHLEKRLKLLPVDFSKPWWQIIADQKMRGIFVFTGLSISYAFSTQLPLYLGYIFENHRPDLFAVLAICWIGLYFFEYFVRLTNTVFQVHCIHGIYFAAHKFFLTVDPIFHSERSSGVVINKTQRASQAYEDILDSFTSNGMLEMLIGTATVIITFFATNNILGIIALFTVIILVSSNLIIFQRTVPKQEYAFLEADDKLKAATVENLSQISLIRSSFATHEALYRLSEKSKSAMNCEAFFWKSFVDIRAGLKNIYALAVCAVGFYIFQLAQHGVISPILATTLILTYLRGTNDIIKLDKPLRVFFRSYARIINFYDFIHQFGTQTFPVIEENEQLDKVSTSLPSEIETHIVVDAVFFDYTENARIFEGHTLNLVVPHKQKIKLYGIIGPSGSGKTTLISILGGQLKPNEGTILINGQNIYALNDLQRRNIVALQGQVASGMRGTLPYNLLFGLPNDQKMYGDDDLIKVLERVGLWPIFKAKNGLKTFIGDGGLNLSGGQRQRLSFAGLYLRAKFFKPALVLIDEPTSSLDEVSERAITQMIIELSKEMVTIVIAHRLKTLHAAIGIMDFSLLQDAKKMEFYSYETLEKESKYYTKLLHGEISLEE